MDFEVLDSPAPARKKKFPKVVGDFAKLGVELGKLAFVSFVLGSTLTGLLDQKLLLIFGGIGSILVMGIGTLVGSKSAKE